MNRPPSPGSRPLRPAPRAHRHVGAPRPTALAGFTLIELLTVIAIIAILMALLFPAIQTAKESARRAQASNDVQNIVAAVKSYNTEYGRFPDVQASSSTSTATGRDAMVGDMSVGGSVQPLDNNSALFYTLRSMAAGMNTGYTMNPRRVVFFEGKQVSNPSNPKAGFLSAGGTAGAGVDSYFDPWGKQYFVVMDTNYDNQLDVPYSDFNGTSAPRVSAGAFSLGKDTQLGNAGDGTFKQGNTKSDDVISWQ